MRSLTIPVFVVALGVALACAGSSEEREEDIGSATPTTAPQGAGPAEEDVTEGVQGAGPAQEEVTEVVPVFDAWMVITATHASKADSEAAFPDGSTWPGRLWNTDKVEGLRPGLWVRSPLITLQRPNAEQGARYYQTDFPDAYVREVRLPEYCAAEDREHRPDVANDTLDCSAELPPADCTLGDGSWRVIVAFDFRPQDAVSEDWSWTSSEVVAKDGMGGVRTLWTDRPVVELPGREGETLDIRTVTDEAYGYVFVGSATPPIYEGQSMNWMGTFSGASQAFGVNLIPVGFL